MAVRVLLFAAARDAAGASEVAAAPAPLSALLDGLVASRGPQLARILSVCTVLVDGTSVPRTSTVAVPDGAEVAILPPVSGGAGGPSVSDGVVEEWIRRPAEVSVARALASATRARIYEHVRGRDGGVAVRDVADDFGLHPNVARTHLETLADAGLVAVGLRRRSAGGRPAKVYRALGDGRIDQPDDDGAGLVVDLLTALAEAAADAPVDLSVLATEVAQVEGRRLGQAAGAGGPGHGGRGPQDLVEAAEVLVSAFAERAPGVRLLRVDGDVVEVTAPAGAAAALRGRRPRLGAAVERGLLSGALGALVGPVELGEGPRLADGTAVWRITLVDRERDPEGSLTRLDLRGVRRETGVATAMRAAADLEVGALLEVIADGPGSPARYARWIDRAGHELLAVERVEDAAGRGIRLLIRKGS